MLRGLLNSIWAGYRRILSPSPAVTPSAKRRGPVRKAFGPDRIGIVGFNDMGFVIARPAMAYTAELQARSRNLHRSIRGSYTNIADGLRKSLGLLEKAPAGALKRIWLLSDGYSNKEADRIMDVVEEICIARVNVNTIGFGDSFDERLLKKIAFATHNGKYVRVKTLRNLTDALLLAERIPNGTKLYRHRMEWTVICVDLSGSMVNPMGCKRKVEIVEEAILRLLHFKQQCFS